MELVLGHDVCFGWPLLEGQRPKGIMTTQVTLEPYAVMEAGEGDTEVVAFNVGPDFRPYVVAACDPLDYHRIGAGGASFSIVTPGRPQKYRVISIEGPCVALDLSVGPVLFNVHDVQPLGDGILLACARSYRRGPEDFDLNAHVYDYNGNLLRSFLLGDGIESIQASATGTIWAGYFDEGVFGNFGWKQPVGASGLVAWSSEGKRLYEFESPSGLDSIADCYALNVASETVTWCYYYTEFALVRVCDMRADAYWRVPISGSHLFAISGDYVLFGGGYHDADTYSLFQLQSDNKMRLCRRFELRIESGTPQRRIGRGDAIWLQSGSSIYRFSITDALSIAGIERPGSGRVS